MEVSRTTSHKRPYGTGEGSATNPEDRQFRQHLQDAAAAVPLVGTLRVRNGPGYMEVKVHSVCVKNILLTSHSSEVDRLVVALHERGAPVITQNGQFTIEMRYSQLRPISRSWEKNQVKTFIKVAGQMREMKGLLRVAVTRQQDQISLSCIWDHPLSSSFNVIDVKFGNILCISELLVVYDGSVLNDVLQFVSMPTCSRGNPYEPLLSWAHYMRLVSAVAAPINPTIEPTVNHPPQQLFEQKTLGTEDSSLVTSFNLAEVPILPPQPSTEKLWLDAGIVTETSDGMSGKLQLEAEIITTIVGGVPTLLWGREFSIKIKGQWSIDPTERTRVRQGFSNMVWIERNDGMQIGPQPPLTEPTLQDPETALILNWYWLWSDPYTPWRFVVHLGELWSSSLIVYPPMTTNQ